MTKINGGQAVVRVLQEAGINTVFGLEGGHIDLIIHAAREAGMTRIDTRHEAVAGYAADAHVRLTGSLACCVTTAGPGFTNAITAITSSFLDRIPVLHIVGATPLAEAETNALQGDFDQIAMVRPVTKWAGRATSVEMIAPLARAAIRAATSGSPGPALLEIPIDVMFSEMDSQTMAGGGFPQVTAAPAPSPTEARRALMLLANAERPVILAGSGALLSGAHMELQQFARKAGIPVFANIKALGIVPAGHPCACGSFTDLARSELNPDVVCVLGARNGMFMGGLGNSVLPADAKIIHVDIDAREIGRIHAAEIGIASDVREVLECFLKEDIDWRDRSEWLQLAGRAPQWHHEVYADAMSDEESPIHPYRAARTIAEFIDSKTIVCQEGGDTGGWAEIVSSGHAAGPGKYLAIGYLGNLGMHQGFAIAAQNAFPDHRVICFSGDGAAGFQIQEFDTMVRHGLPVVVVIFNNLVWGMSYEYQIRQPYGLSWVELEKNMRYDLIAEACGGHGEFVETIEQLRPAMERAIASGKPACVNVVCRSHASPKTEAFMKAEGVDDIIMPYYQNLKRQ